MTDDEEPAGRKGLRTYLAIAEILYLGRSLPDDLEAALVAALQKRTTDMVRNISVARSSDPYNVLIVAATVRERTSSRAMDMLVDVVDKSLIDTGVFEEFDVSGKLLRVAPQEATERIRL